MNLPTAFLSLFTSALVFSWSVHAQDRSANPDSLLTHDLEEIVVSTDNHPREIGYSVQRVRLAEIEREDATTVSDLARLVSGAHLQTNSRGESLIYMRNAGERQVALYLNGALLNIPWDNRMNLDMVPANVIGGMTTAKGVPSVLYGTNALGGAINLSTRSVDQEGHYTELELRGGSETQFHGSGAHFYRAGSWQGILSGVYSTRDAVALPQSSGLAFSQRDVDLRTNTDRSFFSGFGQISHQFKSGAQSGLSLIHVDGSYGIAPESHLDPSVSRVRFWRYPVSRNTLAILNTVFPLSQQTILRHAIWAGRFNQEIDDYSDDSYSILNERQEDTDLTTGTRISLVQDFERGRLSAALNGLLSEHRERVREADTNGMLSVASGQEAYQQLVFSAGAEYEHQIGTSLKGLLGASFDGISTPKTGDKPGRDPLTNYGFSAGIEYTISNTAWTRISTGRKTRFPTLRELFGVALNRFLLNPDLKAESSLVGEWAIGVEGSALSGEVIVFLSRTYDTIDQVNVEVEEATLRQRINLEGSRNRGIEFVGKWQPAQGVLVDLNYTLMKVRGLDGDETFLLTEKPASLARIQASVRRPSGLTFQVQSIYTGRAYGREEDNSLTPLPKAMLFDTRIGYTTALGDAFGEVFFRIDNLFDQLHLSQLGLPAAGRSLQAGLAVSF